MTWVYRVAKLIPWTKISRLGQRRILKSAYVFFVLVPVAAHVFLKVGPDLTVFGVRIALGLPFSWQVFYFASVGLSVATFIYQLSCPWIIQEFKDLKQFRERGHGEVTLRRVFCEYLERGYDTAAFIDDVMKDPQEVRRMIGDYVPAREIANFTKFKSDRLDQAFWRLHEIGDLSKPLARLACSVFYFVGFALAFVVALEHFWSVVRVSLAR